MYVTVKEAIKITEIPERTLYRYIKKGLLRTDPESKNTKLKIEDVYKIREEKRK